jgi:hypothetical protein
LAAAVGARAFTVGREVFFGEGEWAPGTARGDRLLAHELAHTLQAGDTVRRVSYPPPEDVPAPADLGCDSAVASPDGARLDIGFGLGVDSLSGADQLAVQNLAHNWHATGTHDPIRIDGYASADGNAVNNWYLSCRRALAVRRELEHPSDGSPPIPGEYVATFANGETDQFSDSLAPNRIATIHVRMPSPPPPPPGCQQVTSRPPSPMPFPVGTRGVCGSGPDFASHDFPGVPLGIRMRQPLLWRLRLMPDGLLETTMHREIGAFAGSTGTAMAAHFDGGSGSPVTYGVGSSLSTEVAASPTFDAIASAAEATIDYQVGYQLGGTCHVDWQSFDVLPAASALPPASFNVLAGDTLLLQAVLGGTQGLTVSVRDFTVNPVGNTYHGTLIYEICDDFGVDETDLDPANLGHGSPGLVAFWILQHERPPGHVAFVNRVTVERPFSGAL